MNRPDQARVLGGVVWSFIGDRFSDRADFNEHVRKEQIEFGNGDTWRADEDVIGHPRIRVIYMCWRDGDQIEPAIELASDKPGSFSAGDLLFKLHNAVVEDLRDIDHHFFQGLVLQKPEKGDDVPVYRLSQGS